MTDRLAEAVSEQIEYASDLYHRLVLVVGTDRPSKTAALRDIAVQTGAPVINVNLELSRQMLDIPERQRPLRVQRILEQIVAEIDSEVVLLDNIELLFDPSLRQDPLRLLRGLSRNRTTVAAWSGSMENGNIYYAERGHPEYRRYSADGILAVSAQAAKQ